MTNVEAESSKKPERDNAQKEPPINLLPLALVFCLGASESICNFIYKDHASSTQEENRHSWTGINTTLIRILGALFAGILMEKQRRIIAVRFSFAMLITGLVVVYFVDFQNSILFSIGDWIIKFASGMEASSIVCIAEYNTPKKRGKLLLSIVPVTVLSYYTPQVVRSHKDYHSISEYEEILIVIAVAVVFLCLSGFYVDVPVRKGRPDDAEPATGAVEIEEERKSSDFELEECSTSTYDSDDDPKAKLPEWMDSTHPSFAISFFILFSVWPKVGLLMLIDRYKPELMLKRDEQTIDHITSLVMLISSVIGFLFLNYCKRRTFLILYSLVMIISSISNAIFEYLFEGVPPQYKLPGYSFVPLVSVWINLGLTTIGSWTMMMVVMGELTTSRKRGLVTGILWAVMLLQSFIVRVWLNWMESSMPLYRFHLLMVFIAFKILMWARSYGIDGRDKTQEQIDILWEEVVVRRRARYKFYRKCLMCCMPRKEKVESRAEILESTES